MSKKLIIFFMGLFLLFAGTSSITIYHINDFHDQLISPVGAARLIYFIKSDSASKKTLFLVAGDLLSGTAFARLTRGEASFKLFREFLKPDAYAVGNHEFDFGWKRLLELNEDYSLPLISANVYKEGRRLFPEAVKLFLSRQRIVIAGLTTKETVTSTFKKLITGLQFEDEIEAAKRLRRKYRKQADLLILLSHCGIEKDREIARKVKGFDLIIGGHDHKKAIERIGSTLIVQAGAYGKYVGKIEVRFHNGKKQLFPQLISLKNYTPSDHSVETYISQLNRKLSSFLNRFCCLNRREIRYNERRIRSNPDPLAHFLTETLRKSLSVDAVIINAGAIRGGLPAGKIFYRHWVKVFPFQGQMMILEIEGKYIEEALKRSMNLKLPSTAYLQTAGVKFERNIFIGGKKLEPEKIYRVVVPEFLFMGGDGYTSFKRCKRFYYVNMTFPEFFFAYFKKKGKVEPPGQSPR